MFLPTKVQERVREVQVMDSAGNLRPLVRSEQVLYEATGRAPEPQVLVPVVGRHLIAGVVAGTLILLLAWGGAGVREKVDGTGKGTGRAVARAGFAFLAGGWAALSGAFGLLLAALWGLTNHSIAYQNENLLQANPLALPLVLLVPALALGARWAERPALWFSTAVAAASVAGLLAGFLPWFSQLNGDIIALALPVNLAVAVAVHLLRRASHSPRAGTSSDSRGSRRSVSAGLCPPSGTGRRGRGR
jgi:hypothetical protein